jgi:heme A synthase
MVTKNFFKKYSWFLVGYNVLVILWGAVVRSTGSGAGCGSHWPLCNGEIIPAQRHVEQLIEYIHRVTSTLDGLLVILLVIFAFRLYAKGSQVRRWAVLALTFILIEGALGRALVVNDWVAFNMSVARAVVVSVHLANTYILLATLTVTAWYARHDGQVSPRGDKLSNILVWIGLGLVTIFSAMGAVTALGDTLFPPESLLIEVQRDLDPASHFLIQLRVIHPLVAILSSGYLFYALSFHKQRGLGARVVRFANLLFVLISVQVLAGGITILTLAPLVMQIIHLVLADTLWITLVVFALEVFHKRYRQDTPPLEEAR